MNKTVFYTEKPAPHAKLIIFTAGNHIEEITLASSCVLGRRYEGSDAFVQLDSPIVSRRHGELAVLDGACYYRDLSSLNGTFLNDALVHSAIKLEHGDILRIDQREGKGRHPDAVVMIFATVYPERDEWAAQPLDDSVGEASVGRAVGEGGLALESEAASRNHATFFRHADGWAVADHDSLNGVFVNNRRIANAAVLQQMDVVRIADTHFVFTGDTLLVQRELPALPVDKPISPQPEESALPAVAPKPEAVPMASGLPSTSSGKALSIRIIERNVWQRFKRLTLLQNINITIKTGEMVLILGGSGSGKTTLLNAIMGYEKADGEIFYGDTDIYNEYERMKYEIGFVPQQDLLRGSDTVAATLQNAADMKLPRAAASTEKTARVAEVMEVLGLKREGGSLVSKLSGGQRKRLSIAVEYIANPSLFFLDEPDSGLDGVMALSLHENLRTIADSGKIVVVITHTPDRVAKCYDKVIVLAKSTADNSGHLAFFGSVAQTLAFFGTESLESVVRRINRLDEGGEGRSDEFIRKYEQMMR